MKKIVMSWAVAMVAVAGLSASANATLVTFNLNGDGGRLGNAYTFSSDGYDMTARAQEEVDTGWINRRNVYQTNRGLGVKGRKEWGYRDSGQIDGWGREESKLNISASSS